jgi:Kdo2-lipid IVA lauroyltransferase/acyltransferase
MIRKVMDWLAYLIVRCVICLMQTVSLERADRICRLLARGIDQTRLRRKIIDENFKLVFGNLEACQATKLRVAMWHHLLLMIFEITQAPRKIHRTNWRDHFYIRDKEAVLRLLMDPRPTVLVTGHFGNFELAGFVTGLFGIPSTTIARPLDNPHVHNYITDFRSMGGQHMLPKDGSAPAVQEILTRGGTLALLADQHAGGKGCWVDFFGHPTSCHKALALFVLSSHATMVVCYNRRVDRPLRFELGASGLADPLIPAAELESVAALTRWYNEKLEAAIRMAPEQYWWLHRRWRDVPPNRIKAKPVNATAA